MAQVETSEVLGTVRDAGQLPVAEAAVTLTDQATGIEAKTSITVESEGFSKFTAKDIAIDADSRQRVRHHPLHLSGAADSVRAEADVLG